MVPISFLPEEQNIGITARLEFQSAANIVLRECTLLEVEFHQPLVMLGGGLHEYVVKLGGAFGLRSRDFELLARTILIGKLVHLHHQHVDKRVETRTGVQGILHDHGTNPGRSA